MPRQRGRSSAPARAPTRPTAPAPAPARHAPQQQSRGMTTTAAQPPATQAPPQQGRSPGLFGQMASTAAGVAVGSSIGHAIGGFFGGGSSQAEQAPAAEAQTNANAYGDNYSNSNSSVGMANCEPDARAFTRCLDENKGEYQMSVCGWYLEQLKACQSAAKQY